jgi:hypothetical protein
MEQPGEWADSILVQATAWYLRRDVFIVTMPTTAQQPVVSIGGNLHGDHAPCDGAPLWVGLSDTYFQSLQTKPSDKVNWQAFFHPLSEEALLSWTWGKAEAVPIILSEAVKLSTTTDAPDEPARKTGETKVGEATDRMKEMLSNIAEDPTKVFPSTPKQMKAMVKATLRDIEKPGTSKKTGNTSKFSDLFVPAADQRAKILATKQAEEFLVGSVLSDTSIKYCTLSCRKTVEPRSD